PLRHLGQPREAQRLGQGRAILEGRVVVVTVAALGIEATALRDRLQEGRLAAAVLADEEGDVAAEREVDPMGEGPHVEGVARAVGLLREEGDAAEERAGAVAPGASGVAAALHLDKYGRGREAAVGLCGARICLRAGL